MPDVIVHLGDHWDFPSLNGHDQPGSAELEGARYQEDVEAGNEAFARLCAPMEAEQARRVGAHRKQWHPRKIFIPGNHEDRADRVARNDPKWTNAIGSHHCQTRDWERPKYLEIVDVDGVNYSHFFANQHSGKPIGGSVENRLSRIGRSFAQGHEQGLLYGIKQFPGGLRRQGIVAGSFYLHDERYRGMQCNGEWRGVVVLNEVQEGTYDIMPLSLEYLRRKYG